MINKKSQGIALNAIIIVSIALIVFVVLVAIFTGRLGQFSYKEEFNPDDDVCLEWKYQMGDGTKFSQEWYDKEKEYLDSMEIYPKKICEDWRPKTYCEKNPDDQEKCVCEEQKEVGYSAVPDYCVKGYNCSRPNYDFIETCERYEYLDLPECEQEIIYDCIKSREKNECEKGNLDWIEDCKMYRLYAKDNTSFNGLPSYLYTKEAYEQIKDKDFFTDFVCEEKICRKKTIEDGLDCYTLKRALYIRKGIDGEKHCDKYQLWGICFSQWKEEMLSLERIYDLAIEKGCEI